MHPRAAIPLGILLVATCIQPTAGVEAESCPASTVKELAPAGGLFGVRPQIILFGDSITEQGTSSFGWTTQLTEHYGRVADVFNRGFSGYTSALGLAMVRQFAAAAGSGAPGAGKHTFAAIFFGANDATAPDFFVHVPLEEYGKHLSEMISISKAALPEITLLLISPPPVDGDSLNSHPWYVEGGRSQELTGAYAEECGRVAQAEGVLFLDLHSLMIKQPNWRDFLSDGLHLSPIGQQFLVNKLLKLLEAHPMAKWWHPRHMPRHMPPFSRFESSGWRGLTKMCEWPDEQGEHGEHCLETGPGGVGMGAAEM